MNMSIHLIFAENLRRACMQHASIAAVCTGIGINRQQFNKYLAGVALPNAITLRRICGFLKVSEQELFQKSMTRMQEPALPRPQNSWHEGLLDLNSATPLEHCRQGSELSTGAYYCYYPLQNAPGMLLRSLVVLRRSSEGTKFVRLTVFPSSNGSMKFLAAGKHRGRVLSNGQEFYFLGANRHSPYQLSLMTMVKASGLPKFLSGIILTRSGSDLISSRVCLTLAPKSTSLRDMIRSLGFLHQQTADLNPELLNELFRKQLAL
jgi:transcriptional regulator with XRE-family HTH domain